MPVQDALLLVQIRDLHDNGESGVLALSRNEERVEVFYREGAIEAASCNLQGRRLGDYLVKGGYLQESDVPSVLAEARHKKISFGKAAVGNRFLAPPELADIVRMQALDLLLHVFQNHFLMEGFTTGLRSFYAPAVIRFPYVVLELSRNQPTTFQPDSHLLLARTKGRDLSKLPWYPQELCVLSELIHPTTISGLQAATGIPEAVLNKILGVFERLGIIETLHPLAAATTPQAGSASAVKRSSLAFEQLIPVVTNAVTSEKVEVLKNASSFISEQFKTLKVRLSEGIETPPKVLTVSSPDHQDGKSLVSANLASSFSLDPGRRVVILDCDLRNPTLDKYLGVSSQPGLIQYLGNGHMAPHCYMRRLGNLFFITAGGIAENPIELLSLRKMKDLIETVKADFDIVIMDAPPFSPIADARIVTGLSDGLIMVIRRGKTAVRAIESAFRGLDQSKLLGVVFNDVKPMLFNTHYNRGYYNRGQANHYLYSNGRKIRATRKTYLES